MSERRQVIISGVATPVFVENGGPRVSERDVAAFERQLGARLPVAYREFLLTYNGGSPVVGDVNGRDDDPSVPYQYGDSVDAFYELAPNGSNVPDYARLRTPREHPWDLPANALPIAHDAGGNAFVLFLDSGLVRFVDHERCEDPMEEHRVLADDFLDFLNRFRTIEEDARTRAEETARERAGIENGSLPEGVEQQCVVLEPGFPRIREAIRAAFLRVFDAKGYFAVHDDELSREVLDLVLWMAVVTRGAPMDSAALQKTLLSTWGRNKHGLGFGGYAPGFIDEWWQDRVTRGAIKKGALTREAAAAIAGRVKRA